jgi:OmpA-OmpF porin, OOP family
LRRTKAQIAANDEEVSRRLSDLADYDVKDQAEVYFASGKSTIGEKDKAPLAKLAGGASNTPGHIIEVKGFADSTGNAAANQSLSKDRAYAVVSYLMQQSSASPHCVCRSDGNFKPGCFERNFARTFAKPARRSQVYG